jgi:hypothetical protein
MIQRLNCFVVTFLCFFSVLFGQEDQGQFIPFTNTKITYEGRIGKDGASAILYWPGSQIEVNFKGSSINAIFFDNTGKNYYNIILDNQIISILKPEMFKQQYTLVSGLENTHHNIKIYKRTEWSKGTSYFYGFVLSPGTILLDPPEKKKRKLEFYGNSITAGFAVEDYSLHDRSDSTFTNSYLTYAAVTARYFNAQSHYIVRSGIGIMVSYFPLIMPELYHRLDPNNPESEWDFNKYQPDVVVINLLQNDSYLLQSPNRKEYLYRFENLPKPDKNFIINSYIAFVRKIREKYPKAHIICMLGNLSITKEGSPWPGYITEAVHFMNDPQIHTLFIPYKNTMGHPRIEEQKKMAESLIMFIEKNIRW